MGVASHLGIDLTDYDRRIRTFIPHYEEMLHVAATAIPASTKHIVDLGTGTGALAAQCLARARRAHVTGIDADNDILALAAARLGRRATLVNGSFLRVSLPKRCDAVVTSFALHHLRSRATKAALYRTIRLSLRRGGQFVTVDCQPARRKDLARTQMEAWRTHLRTAYSAREAKALLRAWSHEDSYMTLETELTLMREVGLKPEVVWRRDAFAVIVAQR